MTIPPVILSAARGVGRGIVMGGAELAAGEMRAEREKNGYGTLWEPLVHIGGQCAAVGAVSRALKAAGQEPISSRLGWVLWLTPAVLHLTAENLSPGTIQNLARTAQNHFGTVCLVAFTVSQVAILYFAPTPGAVFSLLFVALTLVSESSCLSQKASAYFQKSLTTALIASQLILAGGVWGCVMLGIGKAAEYYWTHGLADTPEDANRSGQLTQDKFVKIFGEELGSKDFQINLDHLHWSSLPDLPNVEVAHLLTLWDQIPRDDDAEGVHALEMVEWRQCRQRLESVVSSVQDIPPYMPKHMHLKLIAERLSTKPQEVQADLLKQLVDTNWKNAGNFNYDRVFARLTEEGQANTVPFRKKALHELQCLRTQCLTINRDNMAKELGPQGADLVVWPLQSSINIQRTVGTRSSLDEMCKKMHRFMGFEKWFLKNHRYTIDEMVADISMRANMTSFFAQEMEGWWTNRLSALFGPNAIELHHAKSCKADVMILAMLYDLHIIQEKIPS